MSYSFSVSAPTKAEASAKATAEFDQVVANQPIHQKDRDAAEAALASIFGLIQDPVDGQSVTAHVNGSVSWIGDMSDGDITSVSFGVSAGIYGTKTAAVADPEPAPADDEKEPEAA